MGHHNLSKKPFRYPKTYYTKVVTNFRTFIRYQNLAWKYVCRLEIGNVLNFSSQCFWYHTLDIDSDIWNTFQIVMMLRLKPLELLNSKMKVFSVLQTLCTHTATPWQKDSSDIAPLHRHRQRIIIVYPPPWLTESQCRSFVLNF